MHNLTLGFLSFSRFDSDSIFRGAILITDKHTKPMEFRVTSPIKPTDFQITLYGQVLDEHILVELIAMPLLTSLSNVPEIVIVREGLFLGANNRTSIPIIRISKDGEARFGNSQTVESLTPVGGKYDPVILETLPALESQLPELRVRLQDVFSQRDLLEPFSRIDVALKQVHSSN